MNFKKVLYFLYMDQKDPTKYYFKNKTVHEPLDDSSTIKICAFENSILSIEYLNTVGNRVHATFRPTKMSLIESLVIHTDNICHITYFKTRDCYVHTENFIETNNNSRVGEYLKYDIHGNVTSRTFYEHNVDITDKLLDLLNINSSEFINFDIDESIKFQLSTIFSSTELHRDYHKIRNTELKNINTIVSTAKSIISEVEF